jgi:hypothetical protein
LINIPKRGIVEEEKRMTNGNNKQDLSINEGTIKFSIRANKVNYSDNQVVPLFQGNPQGGSIFILKDSDNKIKFFHVFLGKGRTDVEYDVSGLDKSKKYLFVFTWSVKNKEINIYVDGDRKSAKINY